MNDANQEIKQLREEINAMQISIKDMQQRIDRLEGRKVAVTKTEQPVQPVKKDRHRFNPLKSKTIMPESEKNFELKLGQLMNRLGVVAVVIGLAIFLKYSFDHNWIGPTGRIIIGLLIGMGMWGGGEFTRKKYSKYAQGLLGGGNLAMLFSIYAGYGFYDLYSQTAAFIALIAITALTVVLALRHNALAIAILGILGGYFTPVMVGDGSPSPLILFGYLTILTAGVLGVAINRKWLSLNYLSFILNHIYILAWINERPFMTAEFERLLPALIFSTIIFIFYLGITSIYNIRNQKAATNGEALLVGLNALLFFYWSMEVLKTTFIGDYLGFYAVLLACIYIYLGKIAYKFYKHDKKQFFGLFSTALVLITVAIPLQFEGPYVAFGWLIQGAAIIFMGLKIGNEKIRFSGAAVFMLGLLVVTENLYLTSRDAFLINTETALMVFTIIVTGAIAYVYHKHLAQPDENEALLINGFKILFLVEVFMFLTIQNEHFFKIRNYDFFVSPEQLSLSGLWMTYAIILFVLGIKYANKYLRYGSIGLTGVIILKAFFVDLAELATIYKIILFIILGLFLLGISFVYQKKKDVILQQDNKEGM